MSEYLVDRLAACGEDFESSNIDVLGYDRATQTLYVEFASSSTIYSYHDVKESTFDMLVTADSVGSFCARHIKGNYTSYVAGMGVINLREDDEVDLKPDTKWASVPEGETPDFAQGGLVEVAQPHFVINADGVIAPSRYGVKWTNGTLTFEPLFEALSEADALAQFNAAFARVMPDADVKIRAVTHYFE